MVCMSVYVCVVVCGVCGCVMCVYVCVCVCVCVVYVRCVCVCVCVWCACLSYSEGCYYSHSWNYPCTSRVKQMYLGLTVCPTGARRTNLGSHICIWVYIHTLASMCIRPNVEGHLEDV